MARIVIKPSNHAFESQDDETVLEAALREGFVIAYGCRNGACGTCKGKVLEGTVDYGAHLDALSDADKAQGYALFCQAKPLTDLVVECREVNAVKDIQVRTLPVRVQAMKKLAPDVMRIQLKLPAAERLQFLAGQYIDILLRGGMRRSLSMANPPHDDALMELHLRNYGGPFSDLVFNKMKEKDILRFEGPLGTFFLRERHRLRADQGDHRARAAQGRVAADDALLGRTSAFRSLSERARGRLEARPRHRVRAGHLRRAAGRRLDGPHGLRPPRGDGRFPGHDGLLRLRLRRAHRGRVGAQGLHRALQAA
jgi:ferredoxin